MTLASAYRLAKFNVDDRQTGSFIGWNGLKLNEENLVDIGFRFFKNEWHSDHCLTDRYRKFCLFAL